MTDERPGQDDGDRRSPEEWAAERARLRATLDRHKREREAEEAAERRTPAMQGMAQGLKIASEFIAGVVVGAVIGYGIDQVFDTRPFGLIVFLLFGFAAGVLNVIRSASGEKGPARPGNGGNRGTDAGK